MMRKCVLCGYRFEKGGSSCGSCIMKKFCRQNKCPGCGYEMALEYRFMDKIKRFFRGASSKEEGKKNEIVPLSELRRNKRGKVVYVQTHDTLALEKIIALGIFPGINIVLFQKFPAYLFQIGERQLAVDGSIAEKIQVIPY